MERIRNINYKAFYNANFIQYGEFIYDSLQDCFKDEHVQERIFPLVAETSTSFPFIIYSRNDTNFNFLTKDVNIEDITFSISVISDSYAISLHYLEKLYNYYQLSYFTNEKIKTEVISTSESYQDEAFTQNITIKIIK
jgi:hypothetical protein